MMKRKLLSAVTALLLAAALAGCTGSAAPAGSEALAQAGDLKIGIDLSQLEYPETVKSYTAALWEFTGSEEEICELFLGDKELERMVWAPGPSYYYYDDEDKTNVAEGIQFRDGGAEFTENRYKRKQLGFHYFYNYPNDRSGDVLLQAVQCFSEKGRINLASTNELSFGTIDEARKEVLRYIGELGLPEELQLSYEGGFTAETLYQADTEQNPSLKKSITIENHRDYFLFLFGVSSDHNSSLSIYYTEDGIVDFDLYSIYLPNEVYKEEAALPLEELLEGIAEKYTAQDDAELTAVRMLYSGDEILEPKWLFTVVSTVDEYSTRSEIYRYRQEIVYDADPVTGKIREESEKTVLIVEPKENG